MRQSLLPLLPNRVRRNYTGGLCLDQWEGRPSPQDGSQPEDWLASTTPAVNRGMPEVIDEGLGRVIDAAGCSHRLSSLFEMDGEYYLGRSHLARIGPNLGFLAKLLDSSMRLHTQVHPTRDFSRERLDSPHGKLECYVILAVREGSEGNLRLGFQHAPSREEWREIVAQQDIARMDACFEPVPVSPGQVWWVPGGMVHALGAGLLLLEVMEPSDWVVRCEFEREGIVVPPAARFMGRDLDFCLDVFDYTQRTPEEVEALCRVEPVLLERSDMHEETLAISLERTKCFEIRRLRVWGERRWSGNPGGKLIVVTDGRGVVRSEGQEFPLQPGSRFFLAAAAESVTITPDRDQTVKMCICHA